MASEPPAEPPAPPPPPFPDVEGGECPRCGTPYEPLQEYCLECGLRLPMPHGIISVLSTAWRRRIPWYPGDWIWPVLLAFAIAALGAAIAILVHQHKNEESATKTKIGTQSVPVTPGTGTGTGTETLPPPAGTSTLPTASVPTTAPTAPQPPPPTPSGGLTEWPAGQSGWTVVLASIPQSSGRGAATREARKAAGAGLSDVGVLNSSDFSSLHSGYYVVFSCVCTSLSEAKSNLSSVKSSYPGAYTRQITP